MDAAALPLLLATLRLAAPLAVAAMGELVTERSGVLNIGIEGMMLAGAFAAFTVGASSGSVLAGTVAAGATGVLFASLFAWLVLHRQADPIVTGVALNVLALGVTGTLYRLLFPPNRILADAPTMPDLVGGVNGFLVLAGALAVGVALVLGWTRTGLEIPEIHRRLRRKDNCRSS